MDEVKSELTRDLERFVAAGKALSSAIESNNASIGQDLASWTSGMTFVEVLQSADADSRSETLRNCLGEFEECRRQVRYSLVRVAKTEGVSLGRLARAIGVSRQLVERIGREAGAPARTPRR